MTEEKARKLNVENIVTFVLLFTAIMLAGLLVGIISFDIEGFLMVLGFMGFCIFVGYLINKSGLAKYFR